MNATGVESLVLFANSAAADIDNVSALSSITLKNNSQSANVDYAAAAVSGAADDQAVILENSTSGTLTLDNGIETASVTSNGSAANTVTLAQGTDAITSVTLDGAGDLTLGQVANTVKTINGSAATGDLSVTGTAGNIDMTITGGSGDDTIDMADQWTTADTIDGGTGENVLRADHADFEAVSSAVTTLSNVQTIFADTQLTAGIDLTLFPGVTTLKAAGHDGGADTYTFESGNTFHLTADAAAGAGAQTLKIEGTETDDVLNLKLDAGIDDLDSDTGTTDGLQTSGVEVLNIQTAETAGTKNVFKGDFDMLNVSAGGTSKINITGANEVKFDKAVEVGEIDASESTGALTMGSSATPSAAIKITGGSGGDTIVGSTSADRLIGGAGDDAIFGDGGDDVIDLSDGGSDQIDFDTTAANNGKITVTGFTVGALTDGGDKLDLSDLSTPAMSATTITNVYDTDAELGNANTLANNSINIVEFASTAIASKDFGGGDFSDLFGTGKAFSTSVGTDDDGGIILVQGSDLTHIYAVEEAANEGADSNTTIANGDVDLIGVLNGVTAAQDFVDANFV